MNIKAGGVGIILTFLAVLIEVIFIPLVSSRLEVLKDTAPNVNVNSTIDTMVELLYYTPLGTVLLGFIGSFVGAYAMKRDVGQ
jgi:hypothetical protein